MTNKEYTNEDIISSLKMIATTRNCNECKIRNCKWGTCNCEQITANAALDLINCLQAENEKNENIIRLADKTIETANAEIERLQKEVNLVSIQFQDLQERYGEAQAKIEKLKDANNTFEKAFHIQEQDIKDWLPRTMSNYEIKAEAYKEFAERLKERIYKGGVHLTIEDEFMCDIDKLLKEMAGEDDESR